MTVRVLLVDDQALIRAGFRAIINSADDLDVVGEVDDAIGTVEGLEVVTHQGADLVKLHKVQNFLVNLMACGGPPKPSPGTFRRRNRGSAAADLL